MAEGLLTTAAGLRAGYRTVLEDTDAAVAGLDEAGWNAPTGCPGWSVRDVLAHMGALEARLLGRTDPEHTIAADLPHVRGDLGRVMEVGVDRRRSWPAADVLAEFREVSAARLVVVDALTDDDLAVEVDGLLGRAPLRTVLSIRVFDLWCHEQDIRRALDRPGRLTGPADGHGREQLVAGAGRQIQRAVGPPEGTTLLVDVRGPGGARRTVRFEAGRGSVVADVPDHPTVTLTLDLPALAVLGCGRDDGGAARRRVVVEGDRGLAERMLDHMAFTP